MPFVWTYENEKLQVNNDLLNIYLTSADFNVTFPLNVGPNKITITESYSNTNQENIHNILLKGKSESNIQHTLYIEIYDYQSAQDNDIANLDYIIEENTLLNLNIYNATAKKLVEICKRIQENRPLS